jgi:hypothetical protein
MILRSIMLWGIKEAIMTITLELAPQVETSLSEKASQRGQTLDEYLTRLIERTARLPVDVDPDWGHLQ